MRTVGTLESRARRVYWLLLILLGALIGRAGYLQLVRGDEFAARARRMHFATIDLPAPRGRILDRNGRPLVASYHARSVAVDPQRIDDIADFATRIAFLLGEPGSAREFAETLARYQRAGKRFAYLRRHVDRDVVARIEREHLPGIDLREEPRREYPHGPAAAALLGVVGADADGRIAGLTGLELLHDRELRGIDGVRSVFRSGRRENIELFPEQDVDPRPGRDLHTTLDIRIQLIAEEGLDAIQRKHAPKTSCAIVLDPRTGEILALAGRPALDRDAFPRVSAESLRVPAVHCTYELGSTIKPLIMACALNEGAVHPGQEFDCGPGYKYFGGRRLRDVKANHRIDLQTIIIKSSNIGIAQVGLALGIERTRACLAALGFGTRTGIEVPGEEPGELKPADEWTENYTLVSVSMGRELPVTPLQLARAYAALINGGRLVTPTLLRDAPRPRPARLRFRDDVIDYVIDAMEAVVSSRGTGRRARVAGLRIAGKTGSSEKYPKGSGQYVSSFLGFAPADDPRLLVLVVTDEPKSVNKIHPYGGVVAAPVVGEILRRALPLVSHRIHALPESGVRYINGNQRHDRKVRVAAVHRSSVWTGGKASPVQGRNPDSVGAETESRRRGGR